MGADVKLSPTQRVILEDAQEQRTQRDRHLYFEECVYERNRRGLERIGAIRRDTKGQWFVTDEAQQALEAGVDVAPGDGE